MGNDAEQITALARRAHALADELREDGRLLLARGAIRWVSTAAGRYRGALARESSALQRCADDLDAAALLLLRHADSVGQRERALSRLLGP